MMGSLLVRMAVSSIIDKDGLLSLRFHVCDKYGETSTCLWVSSYWQQILLCRMYHPSH